MVPKPEALWLRRVVEEGRPGGRGQGAGWGCVWPPAAPFPRPLPRPLFRSLPVLTETVRRPALI